MIDFKLDTNGDLDLTGSTMNLISGAEALRQRVEIKLKLWTGDWFLDTEFGTPYLGRILGKQLTLSGAIAAIRQSVLEVNEVTGIVNLTYQYNAQQRILSVQMEINSIYGTFEVTT